MTLEDPTVNKPASCRPKPPLLSCQTRGLLSLLLLTSGPAKGTQPLATLGVPPAQGLTQELSPSSTIPMAMKAPYPQMPDCCWALEDEKRRIKGEVGPSPIPSLCLPAHTLSTFICF